MGAKNKRRFKVNKAERIHYTYDDDTTIRLLSFGNMITNYNNKIT